MKKIMVVLISLMCFVGCSLGNTPTAKVESYLNKYQNNEIDVTSNLDTYLNNSSYTDDQKTKYRSIITKLYEDMKYEVKDEKITEDKATVEVLVKVYNLNKVNKDSSSYLIEHADEFYDENSSYSESKYIDYLLDKMDKNLDMVTNTVIFNLSKIDGKWELDDISETDLMKLHGTYDNE